MTLGLTAASATVVARAADDSWMAGAVTAATALICYFARVNPLWVFAVAALLGLAGWFRRSTALLRGLRPPLI